MILKFERMFKKLIEYKEYKLLITSVLAFSIPLILYIFTLEPKLKDDIASLYAVQLTRMEILPPPGYPIYSLIVKLFTLLPIGGLAYKLNLTSAIFGALTVLILFLSIRLLIQNKIISLAAALIFAFMIPFWSIANRLEVSTFNTLIIVLAIFFILKYKKNKDLKNLYFFFFCAGINFTGHLLNHFIAITLIIYAVFINPKIFRSKKIVFKSILFFLIPLLSYLYIFIRSLQGFGTFNTIQDLIYYVMGRTPSGNIYHGSIFFKSISQAYVLFEDYLKILYDNVGITIMIFSIVGFFYFIKKNPVLAIYSFIIIIVNFYIIIQYYEKPFLNYTLPILMIMSIYISFFFLLIYDLTYYFIKKKFS